MVQSPHGTHTPTLPAHTITCYHTLCRWICADSPWLAGGETSLYTKQGLRASTCCNNSWGWRSYSINSASTKSFTVRDNQVFCLSLCRSGANLQHYSYYVPSPAPNFTWSSPFLVPQASLREGLSLPSDAQDAKIHKDVCISISQCLHTKTHTLYFFKNRIGPVYMQQNNNRKKNNQKAEFSLEMYFQGISVLIFWFPLKAPTFK